MRHHLNPALDAIARAGVSRRDAADLAEDVAARGVHREDTCGDLLPPRYTPDGTMLVEGRIARPGVLRYVDSDGKVWRELVTAETLHCTDSLSTLGRAHLTLEHPPEDVTPDNVDEYGVGDIDGEVTIGAGGFVHIKMAIRRADAIKAVADGKRELSPGYRTIVDPTPGVHPEYGQYDAEQGPRVYNHGAIVDAARGGNAVCLRADGAAIQVRDGTPSDGGIVKLSPALLALLATVGISAEAAARFDSEDAAYKAIDKATAKITRALAAASARADAADAATATEKARADAAEGTVTKREAALSGTVSTLEGTVTALRARLDSIEDAAKAHADAVDRASVVELAGRYTLPDTIDASTASLDDVRRAVATAHLDSLGAVLPANADMKHVHGVLNAIPAAEPDRWGGVLPAVLPAVVPRVDGEDNPSPSKSYYKNADAAFQAAKAGRTVGVGGAS